MPRSNFVAGETDYPADQLAERPLPPQLVALAGERQTSTTVTSRLGIPDGATYYQVARFSVAPPQTVEVGCINEARPALTAEGLKDVFTFAGRVAAQGTVRCTFIARGSDGKPKSQVVMTVRPRKLDASLTFVEPGTVSAWTQGDAGTAFADIGAKRATAIVTSDHSDQFRTLAETCIEILQSQVDVTQIQVATTRYDDLLSRYAFQETLCNAVGRYLAGAMLGMPWAEVSDIIGQKAIPFRIPDRARLLTAVMDPELPFVMHHTIDERTYRKMLEVGPRYSGFLLLQPLSKPR